MSVRPSVVCLSSVKYALWIWCVLKKLSEETNRKWPTVNWMVTWPMTSRDPERSRSCPTTLRAQYLENGWKYYLATIANWLLVCCETVRFGYPCDSLASCFTDQRRRIAGFRCTAAEVSTGRRERRRSSDAERGTAPSKARTPRSPPLQRWTRESDNNTPANPAKQIILRLIVCSVLHWHHIAYGTSSFYVSMDLDRTCSSAFVF